MKETLARLEKKNLKRALNASDLFAIGFGDVGSSIYYALGVTALFALGATPIAMTLAGFVFICTALTYAELSTTFPEPGGSATYARHAFNDLISFIAGWGLLLDYIVTMAISIFAVPPYLKSIALLVGLPPPESTFSHLTLAVVLLVCLFGVNLVGVRYSGRMSFFLAILTAMTQLTVIAFGSLFLLNLPHVFEIMKIGVSNIDLSPSWDEFFKGAAMAMVAYTGIEAIAQLAGETKKPSIAIPRAIKFTVPLLLFVYIGVSVVAMSAISPRELGSTYIDDPIFGIISQFPNGGKLFAPWIGLAAAIILIIASNAGLIGCSRLTFSMSEYYQVPSAFYKTHPRFRTPYVSLAIFTILGCLVVLASRGKMLFLADLYNVGAQIAFFMANLSLIVLRIKKPDLERPFRVPFNFPLGKGRTLPLTAVIGAVANLSVFALVIVTKPEGRLAGLIWMGLGLVMYYFYRKKKRIALAGQLSLEKIKIPEYARMHVKQILVAARTLDSTEALQTACQLAKLHNAHLTAAYIIEVPFAQPIDVPLDRQEAMGQEALKRAEAVASEYNVTIDLELVRVRYMHQGFLDLIESKKFDLIVLGVGQRELARNFFFAKEAKLLLERAPCRVLFLKDR